MQTAALVIAVLALLVGGAALALFWRERSSATTEVDLDEPVDVQALRNEVAALKLDLDRALRHLAVVRYDAFPDVGGRQSWSTALLDDAGSGVVLTSIHGRSETRTYAKGIRDWTSEHQLSPEEEKAVEGARPAHK